MQPKPVEIEVNVSKVVRAKRWIVLRMLSRIEDFPKFMPNVESNNVLETLEDGAITEWNVVFDGIPIHWYERDTFDFSNFAISFQAIKGDLTEFEGRWQLKQNPNGTEVQLSVRAVVGIPGIDQLVSGKLRETIVRNFQLMLDSIDARITATRYASFKRGGRRDILGFGIIGHPYNLRHLVRYLKLLKPNFEMPTEEFLSKIYEMVPSYKMYDIKEFTSQTGKKTHGCFIVSTFIPDMLSIGLDRVFQKVIEACKVAEANEVGIVSLGGFTSIAGEKFGKEISQAVNVPVTTGNTFTVAMAIEGVRRACELMEVNLSDATAVVIGGTGDIGSACTRILAEKVKRIIITGRTPENLRLVGSELERAGSTKIGMSLDNNQAVEEADIVIAAASTTQSILDVSRIKSGAIVCDIGYPKNISYTEQKRDDILIFSGGLTQMPQEIDLGFDIGLPSPRVMYGCFAEAIVLDLESRYESFSFGKGKITKENVQLVSEMGKRHGFQLAPFYWGNRLISETDIGMIRKNKRAMAR
ncbi:NAD(P)-binding domain-containing protein [Candidatus Uhrbacteria bacterium]|nr:NAD(P)-binding domain-containing protein [Candidatus Uhrbacteria bacterium]